MSWSALIDADDADQFGSKAATLAVALRAGLPVPDGVALSHAFVGALSEVPLPEGELAVRASAIDAVAHHVGVLGVVGADGVSKAVHAVRESATGRVGIVVHALVVASIGGVVHARGADGERVVEAAWGLGESVTQGSVVPDTYRLSAEGELLEERAGEGPELCLDDTQLDALHDLAQRCDEVWDGAHDLDWAFTREGTLHLLHRRPVTT